MGYRGQGASHGTCFKQSGIATMHKLLEYIKTFGMKMVINSMLFMTPLITSVDFQVRSELLTKICKKLLVSECAASSGVEFVPGESVSATIRNVVLSR